MAQTRRGPGFHTEAPLHRPYTRMAFDVVCLRCGRTEHPSLEYVPYPEPALCAHCCEATVLADTWMAVADHTVPQWWALLVDLITPWHTSPLFFWRARFMEGVLMGRAWSYSPFFEANQGYTATFINGIVRRAGRVYLPGWRELPDNYSLTMHTLTYIIPVMPWSHQCCTCVAGQRRLAYGQRCAHCLDAAARAALMQG